MSDTAILGRVRALLAKAESTTFEAEAEALTAKAQELIAKHNIDQRLVEARAGDARPRDLPGTRTVPIADPYSGPKVMLLTQVADANGARAVWLKQSSICSLIGFDDDVEAIDLLFTSLLVQATAAMVAAGPQRDQHGRSRTRSFRHSFLIAFAYRIGERLQETTQMVVDEAVAEHGSDLLPVLASRDEAVEERFRQEFPQIRRVGTRASNGAGWTAGRIAADRARLHGGKPISHH